VPPREDGTVFQHERALVVIEISILGCEEAFQAPAGD
jgi:hypothetical protein